jgi:hypothetical protein
MKTGNCKDFIFTFSDHFAKLCLKYYIPSYIVFSCLIGSFHKLNAPSPLQNMGITILEKRFQTIAADIPDIHTRLIHFAESTVIIQSEMRTILNTVTPDICGPCEHKCCEGFPLEGWFTLEDYSLYRVKYGIPVLPLNRIGGSTSCFFLTPEGCSLPENLRPFTCVKINCKNVTAALKALGKDQHFSHLKKALNRLHREVSQEINLNNGTSLSHSVSTVKTVSAN